MGAPGSTGSGRRRRPPWVYGVAALATAVVVLSAAGWLLLHCPSDDGASGQAEPVQAASGSPSAGGATASVRPSLSTLHKAVAQRQEQAEELASDAGAAGRAGGDAAPNRGGDAGGVTDEDVTAARGWLMTALAWREDEAANGPWGLAVERASAEWANPDVQVSVVPATALEAIASDAAVHGALPHIVEVVDQTNPASAAPGEVTLRASVVFGSGAGWTRPGLRLLVGLKVAGGKVAAVFIDDGYVVSDPELLP